MRIPLPLSSRFIVAVLLTAWCCTLSTLHAQTLVAKAGPDQSGMDIGTTVNLDGTQSVGATSYAWSITKKPSGSTAIITNATSALASFVPDRGGQYTVKLTVGNGTTTASDTVLITTSNHAPVANAGPDVVSTVGKTVTLDGTGSTDFDLNKLTYTWTLISHPDTSTSALARTTSSKASLLLDRPGTYVVELVVKDGTVFSAPDQVTISTANTAPVADAGPDRVVALGAAVQLTGAGSSDLDGNPITYSWLLKRPSGSTAVLDDVHAPMPAFTADKAGNYTATLTVSDGALTAKDTVVITTNTNRNPVSRTKADDVSLAAGQTIQLDGGDSTDANGDLLTYSWTITKRPTNSLAALVGASTPRPTFTADKAGSYTFSLLVTDPGATTATDTQIMGTPLPMADAGPDQTATVGTPVVLDGTHSFHLGTNATLAYGWSLISTPAGSTAEFDAPTDPQAQFTPDLPGTYVAELVLFDGVRLSKADTVVISTTGNLPPRANLGPDRKVTTGALVTIDGLATDPDADPLTFTWALLSRPAGSAAALSAATGTPVHITPDVAGDYVVQVAATDPSGGASFDTLVITTGNTTPLAMAPGDAVVAKNVPVPLSATASDPDGGALTYLWSLISKPPTSAAAISSPTAQAPSFTPDKDGIYVVQLLVRDNRSLFAVDAAVFRVGNSGQPPVADAGDPQTVTPGTLVHLDGSGSSDPEGQPLTYTWQLLSKPGGSAAALNNTSIVNPQFTADLAGDYVLRLVVNDGGQNSAPSDVTVTANAAPAANAGPDQNGVDLGVVVNLTGAASTDPESQPLTYSWSFVSKPAGSAAAIASPTSVTPTFTPDVGGVYLVQLTVSDGTTTSPADQVTITTRRLLTLSPSSLSLSSGGSGQLTVTVSYPSPSPLVIQLSSSKTNVATVPANVTILANQLSANFNVTGGATNGGALISAKGADGAQGSAVVAVGARLVQWAVDNPGGWETASNWTGNAVPGVGDVVVIDRPAGNFLVSINAPTAAVSSLLAREPLNIASTLTVDGAAAFEGSVDLNGTLNGTGSGTVNGQFNWIAGTISLGGGLTVLNGRMVSFPNNSLGRVLLNSSLTNHGTVAMGNANALILQSSGTVTNASDGLWTVIGSGVFSSNGGGVYSVVNAGIFRKTGPGNLSLQGASMVYANSGTIDLQGGTAQMFDNATLSNSGLLAVASGTTFFLNQVTLAAGSTFSGTGLLAMNGTTTVTATLTIPTPVSLSGTLTGSGTVNAGAAFTWTGGTISLGGGLTVLSGQTMSFPNNSLGRVLLNSSLTNHGTVAMGAANALILQSSGTVTNASDGLWTVIGSGVFSSNGGGVYSVTNAGTLRKTGGGNLSLQGASMVYANSGTIDLQGGTAQMLDNATLSNSGLLAVASGTTFFLNQVTLAAGTTFSGTGTLAMNGTTTVTTNLTITVPTDLSSSLTGSGAVNAGAAFTWTGGTISLGGGLTVLSGQTMSFPNNSLGRVLLNSSLTNHGTVAMGTANALILQTSGTVTNASDGLWTVIGSGIFSSNGGGVYSVTNAGTLRKTGGGNLALQGASMVYANSGTIDLQGGTAQMLDNATLSNSGLLAVASGTTFFLNQVTLAAGTTFSGTGTLAMNGTTTVTTNLTITVPTDLSSSLTGSGAVNAAAAFTWTGGTISLGGGLTVLSGQTMSFPNNSLGRVLLNSSLTNHGTVAMGTANALILQTSGTVTNASDGLWTVADSGALTSNGAGAYSVTNAGTIRKTGAGAFSLQGAGVPYVNTGTIDLQGGTMQLLDNSTLTNSGLLALTGGTTFFLNQVTLAAGSTFSGTGLLSMNGTTTLTGDITVTVPVTLSGTLTGTGRMRMAAPMTWTGGTLALGQGLDVQSGQTLTFSNTGLGRLLTTGTSLRNFGAVSWEAGSGSLVYQGGSITVRNESGGSWTYGAGGYNITSNGASSPANSFLFVNNGAMQGAGNPATTVTVSSTVSFSGSGTTSNMKLVFVP